MSYSTPNTRARIAARRKLRRANGSQVHPNLWRMFQQMFQTGKIAALLLVLVSLAVLGYLFQSERFHLRQIVVEGNNALRPAEIVALSGLEGDSIWHVDLEAAIGRLQTNAYIEQAVVSIALPDTAVIQVIERQPDVRWQVGGVQYLVDSNYQPLPEVS